MRPNTKIQSPIWCGAVGLLSLAGAPGALANCASVIPASPTLSQTRDVTPLDLVRLRDIGPSAVMFLYDSPIGVSPDGKRLAFQLRRADPDTNAYCLAIYVMELGNASQLRVVDEGGSLIRVTFPRGALAGYSSGEPQLIRPKWSPDGKLVAFLKRADDLVQVWAARADGSGSWPITQLESDAEDFEWISSETIVTRSRPKLRQAWDAIKQEGLSGYVYDERWAPVASNRPWPSEPIPSSYSVVSLGGASRTASDDERARIDRGQQPGRPRDAVWYAQTQGSRAWVAPEDSRTTYGRGRLRATNAQGVEVPCPDKSCSGRFMGVWWNPSGREIRFLRREGWASSELALYAWKPGRGSPRRILVTRDLLLGCTPARDFLVCAQERSSAPRHLVLVDPRAGSIRMLVDPNPEFRRLRTGQTERVHWRTARGIEVFGDLVLPPDYKGNRRLPLVIVQYETRGFLRGGTGDEFPIFAFAANGFAVLSIERPQYVSSSLGIVDEAARIETDYSGWADRRNVLSAFENAIALLDRRGIVDRFRIGITGLSDGTASAQFALLNSDLFTAASLSACCEDPKSLMPLLGPRGARNLQRYGYPRLTDERPEFWKPYSIATNAAKFRTPLLLQAADDEYLMSLETYTALRDHNRPVDLIIYPGEHHRKWQPAHRLAIYQRNLAWFAFWLQDRDVEFATGRDDLRRWRGLRVAVEH